MGFRSPFVKIITAALFRTAAQGNRIEIDGISQGDRIKFYWADTDAVYGRIAASAAGKLLMMGITRSGNSYSTAATFGDESESAGLLISGAGITDAVRIVSDAGAAPTNDLNVGTGKLVVARTGTDPVSVKVNGSAKQLTEGAVDSGGVGYKVLRVPN